MTGHCGVCLRPLPIDHLGRPYCSKRCRSLLRKFWRANAALEERGADDEDALAWRDGIVRAVVALREGRTLATIAVGARPRASSRPLP